MTWLILVSGTPGTGKSSVGAGLAEKFDCVFFEARDIYRDYGVLRPDPTGRETMVIDTERARGVLLEFVKTLRGCAVIADISPSLWMEVVGDYVAVVVLLRLHPLELMRRLEGRGWDFRKVAENVLAESFNVIAEEALDYHTDVIEVDCSGKRVDEIIEEILDKIEEWRTGVSIDWLDRDPDMIEMASRLVSKLYPD